ncbi:MAG: hypothetical protein VW600_14180 [Ferrovibrio sp.]
MTATIDRKSTWQDRVGHQWTVLKPLALVLILGLVAGPLISNYMGWQVTRGFAERQSRASAVDQQAMICAALAHRDTADTAALGWAERRSIAEKYAVMPGRDAADSDVVRACTELLA